MDDVTTGARRLMAMGFEAENVIPIMRDLADVMALSGNQNPQLLSRMTITLGQIKNSSKVSAREIRELTLAGVPANQILQEELGLTAKQVQNIGKEAISGGVALKALLTGIEKRYGGAAAQIATTTGGMLATIKDDFLFLGSDIIAAPMANFKKHLTTITAAMETMRKGFNATGMGGLINSIFPPELQTTARIVIASLGSIWSSVKRLVTAFGPAVSAINEFVFRGLAIALPVMAAVAKAFSEVAYAATHSSPLIKALATALLSLLGAGAAIGMILHLSWAIRVLGIAQAVSGAVRLLAAAIRITVLSYGRKSCNCSYRTYICSFDWFSNVLCHC